MTATRPTCSVKGCDKPVLAKDLCVGHYNRLWRTGDVHAEKPLQTKSFNPHPDTHFHGTKKKCINGHEFNEENTSVEKWPDGSFKCRRCKKCSKIRQEKRKANA